MFPRNAETWLQEQRRHLRWLRAKSIELGIYNPETNMMEKKVVNSEQSNHSGPAGASHKNHHRTRRALKAD